MEDISQPSLLQPLPVPQVLFTDIIMDFMRRLHKSNKNEVIFILVEHTCKVYTFHDIIPPL